MKTEITINTDDSILCSLSVSGNKLALEYLLTKHQTWIYNIALNLTTNADDANDLTQETLIKAAINLHKFEQRSEFRTWVYRILKNQFLNSKRKKEYYHTIPWVEYAQGLDSIEDEEFEEDNKKEVIEEAKLTCMKGMLLCLTPEQRLVYVLGELFELPHTIGSEVMEISKANFRKRLSRTREQLYGFMNNKCGLINTSNPCRCARKTVGFIKKGYVNPENLQFQKDIISKIDNLVSKKVELFDNLGHSKYQKLYQSQYFQEQKDKPQFIKNVLSSKAIQDVFEL
ncbi:RNA polymerase sigma factor [Flavivirga abyssicola]|uniref:RNA polymerase sigma factor n=1 Tax=Flavivirga abyssicola TaxID=3063533 RepID=UPI0026E0C57A|nr:RNA polymerase sigma factor [Flavivirga sp. MEBiC07777]WVK12458.1 RNA polymerase sigma factor [Flavivirga sp. MEBiC07777]